MQKKLDTFYCMAQTFYCCTADCWLSHAICMAVVTTFILGPVNQMLVSIHMCSLALYELS